MMRWLVWILILGFVGISAYTLWLSSQTSDLVQDQVAQEEIPLRMGAISVIDVFENQDQVHLKAGSALIYEHQRKVLLTQVQAHLIERNLKITSESMELIESEDRARLQGNVSLDFGVSGVLRGNQFDFDRATQRMISEEPVEMAQGNNVIQGKSLVYDVQKGEMILAKPVMTLKEGL